MSRENDKIIIGARSGKTAAIIRELKERYPRMSDEEIMRKLKEGDPF